VIQVIAQIQSTRDDELCDIADDQSQRRCQDDRQDKPAARHQRFQRHHQGPADIGANHVKRAMCEIDEVHDPEDQGQTRRHKEKQHAQLKPVQELNDKKDRIHNAPGSLIREVGF